MTTGAQRLVLALGHELANLLAGVRLQAELRDESAASRIAELTCRAGALLSLVRPLLAPQPGGGTGPSPAAVLEALRGGLDGSLPERVEVEEAELGAVRLAADGETLRALLLAAVCASAAETEGLTRVSAQRSAAGVVIVIDGFDAGAPGAGDEGLAGGTLVWALAKALLEPHGGEVRAVAGRLELHVGAR